MPETGPGTAPESPRQARALWRQFDVQRHPGPRLNIGIAASFTCEMLQPFVGAWLAGCGFAPRFAMAPFNQLFQTALDPRAAFGNDMDVITLLWRIEDLAPADLELAVGGDSAAELRVGACIAGLVRALGSLREAHAGTLVVAVPPLPAGLAEPLLSVRGADAIARIHARLVGGFLDALAKLPGVLLLDLDTVQRNLGIRASHDARRWYLHRLPFTEQFLFEAGSLLGRIIAASRIPARKCIVVDCDNTLWGGIIGEDGIDGIALGEDYPGSAFRDFQRYLLASRRQGAFIAIASKNNPEDVAAVFARHDAMLLRHEHVSAWQVNWGPKSASLQRIARQLNIAVDSLVFIDDSPLEIAEVRASLPQVTCIQVPPDPEDMLAAVHGLALFDRLEISDEDRRRADMVRMEREREDFQAQVGHEGFLAGLALQLDLFRAGPEELGRITQLINKTNQFNLTTVRRTLDEVRALARSPEHRIYGVKVADRFGEYGLTGVVIVAVADGEWSIDTLLLSCRVLGRGVESGILAGLAADARQAGGKTIRARFIPTAKNAPAATFLAGQGFVPTEDGGWRLDAAAFPAMPAHINRVPAPATAAREQAVA